MRKLLVLSILLVTTIVSAHEVYLPEEISYKKYDKILHMGAKYTRMYHECVQRTNDEKYCYATVKSLYGIDKDTYKKDIQE